MIEIIGILLTALTMLYISHPLWRKKKLKVSYELNHQAEDLQSRKEAIYAAIRDIEFDYKMGKLSEDDYHELHEQYKGEAIDIMKQVDRVTLSTSKIKTQKDQKTKPTTHFCHGCGNKVDAGAKFCHQCGENLE